MPILSTLSTYLSRALVRAGIIAMLALAGPVAQAQAQASCAGRNTVRLATAAVRANRGRAEAYVCRARAYAVQRDYRRALGDLNTAIRLQPKNSELYLERAQLYLTRDNFSRAIRDLDRAIKAKPTARALRERAWALAEIGEFNRAIADMNAAIKLQPAASDLYIDRGALYARYENFKQAALDGGDARAPLANGRDLDLALKDYQFAAELDRENPRPHVGIALAQRRVAADDVSSALERFNPALRSAEAALDLAPDHVPALVLKAELLALKEDYDSAIRVIDTAVDLAPTQPEVFGMRGRILLDIRDHRAALADANRAITLDRKYAEAYCVRATTLSETGQIGRALRDFNSCLRLATDRETREWASFELTAFSIPANLR
jgi:tetratricopeptide (TPR) repeat protein